MSTAQTLAACLMLAANTYDVPPALMIGIMTVEGGRIGQEVGPNKNGTYDLGPMQINTRWLNSLGKHWNVHPDTARVWVRDDGCVNMHVAAWILKQKIASTGNMWSGVAAYHSSTPQFGIPYAHKVAKVLQKKGLLADSAPEAAPKRIKVVEAQ